MIVLFGMLKKDTNDTTQKENYISIQFNQNVFKICFRTTTPDVFNVLGLQKVAIPVV